MLLALLIENAAKAGGGWIVRVAVADIKKRLEKLPFYARLQAGFTRALGRLDAEIKAETELKDVLAGRRQPIDVEFAKSLSLPLQAYIKHMQDHEALAADMAEALDDIHALLNPQPPLVLRLRHQMEEARFVFGAREVGFLGRGDEFRALDAFLDAERKFAWWLITGAAGQGKSRLALEFCLWRGVLWRAGFLPQEADSSFDWHGWQPERPTLLIVDYAAARAESLHQMVVSLYEPRNPLDFPVRLLLLERDADGPWRQTFEGTGNDRHAIAQCRHLEPLRLPGLEDNDLWQVVEHFCRKATRPPPARAETLGMLKAIDPDCRPLFAHFLADAIAAGQSPRGWNREALTRDVLQREDEKFWRPAHVTAKDRHLLALATMTGGLKLQQLSQFSSIALLPNPRKGEFSAKRYAAMCGRPATERLASLEPDILGELFVLDFLGWKDEGEPWRAETVWTAAWSISPFGMFLFLSRSAQDYVEHPTLIPLRALAADTIEQRLYWSMATVNLILAYGNAGNITEARALWKRLATLVRDHPSEPALRQEQAKGAVNLIHAYRETGEIAPAHTLWKDLAVYALDHPNEPVLREWQAMGAVNLTVTYGNAGEVTAAGILWDDLVALAGSHSGEPAVREEQANGAASLIFFYGNAGEVAAAGILWKGLGGPRPRSSGRARAAPVAGQGCARSEFLRPPLRRFGCGSPSPRGHKGGPGVEGSCRGTLGAGSARRRHAG